MIERTKANEDNRYESLLTFIVVHLATESIITDDTS